MRRFLLLAGALVAVLARAQNATSEQVRAVVVAPDGGTPSFILLGAAGQAIDATQEASPALYVRFDAETFSNLDRLFNDNCTQGRQIYGVSVSDQAIGATSTHVPRRSDGGFPADDPTLVDVFVQNVSTSNVNSLRCVHNPFDGGVTALCTRGIQLSAGSGVNFPVRYPDALACICCNTASGTATTGCAASSTVRLCAAPP